MYPMDILVNLQNDMCPKLFMAAFFELCKASSAIPKAKKF